MDPTITIMTAIAAGAAVASKDVAAQAVKDAYTGLKTLISRKFGDKADVESAIQGVEKKPGSDSRLGVLREELEDAQVGQANEVIEQAKALLELLEEHGEITYQAELHGSGAIAQGAGAQAAGERGVIIGGDTQGSTIITGDENKTESKK
jgi:hypothetical protein